MGTGFALSVPLALPIGLIDLLLAFDNSVGNWAASFLIFPYAIFFGIALVFRWKHYTRLGKGLVLGGAILSTLIIVGIIFLALMLNAATEFG